MNRSLVLIVGGFFFIIIFTIIIVYQAFYGTLKCSNLKDLGYYLNCSLDDLEIQNVKVYTAVEYQSTAVTVIIDKDKSNIDFDRYNKRAKLLNSNVYEPLPPGLKHRLNSLGIDEKSIINFVYSFSSIRAGFSIAEYSIYYMEYNNSGRSQTVICTNIPRIVDIRIDAEESS